MRIKIFLYCPNSTSWMERANIALTDDYLISLPGKLRVANKPVGRILQAYIAQRAKDTDGNLLHIRMGKLDELLAKENEEE